MTTTTAETIEPPAIGHTNPRNPGDRTPVVLDTEHALLGALLRAQTVADAASVLVAVADEDFADPFVRQAIGLARATVANGVLPVPSVLLARMTTQHGTHQWKVMALLFVDAWWAGPPAIAAWPLVLAVLEAAYRRATRRWADRIRQASEEPLDILARVLDDRAEVDAVARRLPAARNGTARVVTAA